MSQGNLLSPGSSKLLLMTWKEVNKATLWLWRLEPKSADTNDHPKSDDHPSVEASRLPLTCCLPSILPPPPVITQHIPGWSTEHKKLRKYSIRLAWTGLMKPEPVAISCHPVTRLRHLFPGPRGFHLCMIRADPWSHQGWGHRFERRK